MRLLPILFCLALPAAGLCPSLCFAQVTTNDAALQGLQPAPVPQAPAAAPTPPLTAPRAKPASATPRSKPARPAKAAASPGLAKPPAVPAAPPPNLVLVPPPPSLPEHKRAPPPAVPVKPDAPGTVVDLPGGSRILFGAGSADLNPATNAAILALAARAKADPALRLTITAWAPGTPEDPSTPRRLSLDRALAARAVLINAGIASERVFAIAKGFNGIEAGPPDRMDIVAAAAKTAPAGTPVAPPAPAATAPARPK